MAFKSKRRVLVGTSVQELEKQVNAYYRLIQKHNPRRVPHIKSKYFYGGKVFINLYWPHVKQSRSRQRQARLRLFNCAIDLIQNTMEAPAIKPDPANSQWALYRFYGQSADGIKYCVQLKVHKKSGRRYFISAFPAK